MKLITWNVNSVRLRMPRLAALLHRHEPDVVCLQETKTTDELFPVDDVRAQGYEPVVFGQKAYNGVALLSRLPVEAVQRGFAGDPTPEDARVISADVGGVRVIDAYVINGQSPSSDRFRVKLQWLDALARWIANTCGPDRPVVLCGDFNVAPDDRDVHDPRLWRGRLLCTDDERRRLSALARWGLRDLLRERDASGGQYTWWDYRYGAFRQDRGLRIDLVLGTAPIVECLRSVTVDRQERDPNTGEGKPSDHAPVVAVFDGP